jgi:DNA-binding SARP family transcriptional activator
MSNLQISLFGRVRLTHEDWSKEIKLTHSVQGLLAYLLLHRHRTFSRDVLAALYWGEQSQDKARGSLYSALWRLRTVLEPDGVPSGTYLSSCYSSEVGFNHDSPYWLDVAVFEEQITRILDTPYQLLEVGNIEKMESVLQLYSGELLEGFYDDWALRERERLRSLYLNALTYLMRYQKFHGNYEKGLTYGRKILELDPLREEIHREMMWLYVESGQRALALRHYETCRDILKTELNVQPMEETQSLYAKIHSRGGSGQLGKTNESMTLQEILQQLHQAILNTEYVREMLSKAILSMEVFVEEKGKISRNKLE